MVVAFVLSQLAALPDALLALWLMLLGQRRSGTQTRHGEKARRLAGCLDRRDVVSPHRQHRACSAASGTE